MLDCLLWLSLRALSSKSLEIRKPLTSTSFLEASSPTADGGISPGTPGGLDDWADKLITPNSKASAYRKYLQVMQSWFFRYGTTTVSRASSSTFCERLRPLITSL